MKALDLCLMTQAIFNLAVLGSFVGLPGDFWWWKIWFKICQSVLIALEDTSSLCQREFGRFVDADSDTS